MQIAEQKIEKNKRLVAPALIPPPRRYEQLKSAPFHSCAVRIDNEPAL